jgi:hypothetical protein
VAPHRPLAGLLALSVLIALACSVAACSGEIGDAARNPAAPADAAHDAGPGATPSSTGLVGSTAGAKPTSSAPVATDAAVSDTPTVGLAPLRRLGKTELHNTLRDLFPSLPADFDSKIEVPADNDVQLAFSLPGTVSDLEVKRFMDLAEAALSALGANAPHRNVDCAGSDETACARTFIASFGKRAYRRPVDPDELTDLLALYSKLRTDPDLAYGLEDALGIVVQAILQSPGFLYRWERGLAPPLADGALVKFDDYEIASRLSYFLWNSLPDSQLMAVADASQLHTPDQIAAQAARLLADPRTDDTFMDFVSQWLELGPLPQLIKDANAYPDWKPELLTPMRNESTAFARDVLRSSSPTFANLLTARYTFVAEPLATYYDVTPDRDGRVDLSGTARLGLLTQAALMAVKGNSYRTSPVRRGKFILNRLLCQSVPPPPPNVVPELPPPDPTKTLREQMAMHRDSLVCASCHDRLDNLGFAFEHFDGAGNYRETEGGHAIDATGSALLDGTKIEFRDATELVQALANSKEAQACFARQWLRYALDRFEQPADDVAVGQLATSYTNAALDTRKLIVEITRTLPFTHRAPAPGEDLSP